MHNKIGAWRRFAEMRARLERHIKCTSPGACFRRADRIDLRVRRTETLMKTLSDHFIFFDKNRSDERVWMHTSDPPPSHLNGLVHKIIIFGLGVRHKKWGVIITALFVTLGLGDPVQDAVHKFGRVRFSVAFGKLDSLIDRHFDRDVVNMKQFVRG